MRGLKVVLHIFIFLYSLTVFSQKQYVVTAVELNVREKPNAHSKVIGKLKKGDTITANSKINNWLSIKYKYDNSYVNKKFVTQIDTDNINLLKENSFGTNFKNHLFSKGTFYSMLFVFIVIGAIDRGRKRIKDARFKTGYREVEPTGTDMLKYSLYAVIIVFPISLICSLYTAYKIWLS